MYARLASHPGAIPGHSSPRDCLDRVGSDISCAYDRWDILCRSPSTTLADYPVMLSPSGVPDAISRCLGDVSFDISFLSLSDNAGLRRSQASRGVRVRRRGLSRAQNKRFQIERSQRSSRQWKWNRLSGPRLRITHPELIFPLFPTDKEPRYTLHGSYRRYGILGNAMSWYLLYTVVAVAG